MTTPLLQVYALALSVTGGDVERAELITAFAVVESSCRPDVRGDGGKAWGLFQFWSDRWNESGGLPGDYGIANELVQIRVMNRALGNYKTTAAKCGYTGADAIRFIANIHNGVMPRRADSQYSRKIAKALELVRIKTSSLRQSVRSSPTLPRTAGAEFVVNSKTKKGTSR